MASVGGTQKEPVSVRRNHRRGGRPARSGTGWVRLPVTPSHVRLFVRGGCLTEQHLFDLYRPYNPAARQLFRLQLRGQRFLPPPDADLSASLETAVSRVPGEVRAAVAMTSSLAGRLIIRVSTTAGEWFVKHGPTDDGRLRNETRILIGIPPHARAHFAWPPVVVDDRHGLTLVTRRVAGHSGRRLAMSDCLDASELLAGVNLTHADLNPQNLVLHDSILLVDLETARAPLEPWLDLASILGLGMSLRRAWTAPQARQLLEDSAPRLERYATRYDASRDWRHGLAAALEAGPWDRDEDREAALRLQRLLTAEAVDSIPGQPVSWGSGSAGASSGRASGLPRRSCQAFATVGHRLEPHLRKRLFRSHLQRWAPPPK